MSDKNLLSIKKFSAFTGIEDSTLRYYDEIGLFSPVKRGDNGYRYYSPTQIVTVNLINVLSSLKFPLKRISELGVRRAPQDILDLIEQQEFKLDADLRRLYEAYSVVHTFRKLIKEGLSADTGRISVLAKDEMRVVLGDPNQVDDMDEAFYRSYIQFCEQAPKLRINLNYPVGGYFEDMDRFLQRPSLPARFFSADPSGNDKCEAGNYLIGYTRGYYGEMGDLPLRMKAYADEHSLTLSGPVHVIYLHDEISIKTPDDYLARASVRVSGP
ncbi:MAG: MerR family transcriptional regulator [Candidatus Accumulibacter sp.]|nr:MerR family transcriptional regulator [Accumulibacter sp.]